MANGYLVNMSNLERAFVDELAWRRRQKLSQLFRSLIDEEMKRNPDVVQIVQERMRQDERFQKCTQNG